MQIIKKYTLAIFALALFISPLTGLAAEGKPMDKNSSSERIAAPAPAGDFCTRISNTQTQLNGLLKKLSDNRGSIRTKMLQNLSDRKSKRADEVKKIRDEWQSKFAAHLDDIGKNATTDAQKAAVAVFKTAVTNAQATRKTAVDKAVSDYQTAAQSTITDRENKIKEAATAFQASVNAAVTQAKTDCTNKVAPATARETMFNSIKTANQTFRAVVTALPDGTLVTLAKTRDAAIQAASQAFKTAVQQAGQTLKAALATP